MVEHNKPVAVENYEVTAEEYYIRAVDRQDKILDGTVSFKNSLDFGYGTNPVQAKPILLRSRGGGCGRLFR